MSLIGQLKYVILWLQYASPDAARPAQSVRNRAYTFSECQHWKVGGVCECFCVIDNLINGVNGTNIHLRREEGL